MPQPFERYIFTILAANHGCDDCDTRRDTYRDRWPSFYADMQSRRPSPTPKIRVDLEAIRNCQPFLNRPLLTKTSLKVTSFRSFMWTSKAKNTITASSAGSPKQTQLCPQRKGWFLWDTALPASAKAIKGARYRLYRLVCVDLAGIATKYLQDISWRIYPYL